MHRVVVTGIGAITPIGSGSAGLLDGIRAGRSAVDRISRFDPDGFDPASEAGVDPDPGAHLG